MFINRSIYMIFLCSFFCSEALHAQDRKLAGTVKSEGEPLAQIHVFLTNTSIGTITNDEGRFELSIPSSSERAESLTFSSIGFQTLIIPLRNIINGADIEMKPLSWVLEDVVVEGSLSDEYAKKIFELAIDYIPENYPRKKYIYEAFFRELSIKDGQASRLIEAAVQIEASGYKKLAYDPENLTSMNQKVKLLELRRSDDTREYLSGVSRKYGPFGPRNELYEILNDDCIKFIGRKGIHTLNFKGRNDINYIYNGTIDFEGDSLHWITLTNRHYREWLVSNAHFYIQSSDWAIVKFERENIYNNDSLKSQLDAILIDGKYFYHSTTQFKRIGAYYYPHYTKTRKFLGRTDINHTNGSNQHLEIELMLVGLDTTEQRLKTRDVLADGQDIYNVVHPYNEAFWKNYNFVLLNPVDTSNLERLEQDRDIDIQFKQN